MNFGTSSKAKPIEISLGDGTSAIKQWGKKDPMQLKP
jgi:hypothetical protein